MNPARPFSPSSICFSCLATIQLTALIIMGVIFSFLHTLFFRCGYFLALSLVVKVVTSLFDPFNQVLSLPACSYGHECLSSTQPAPPSSAVTGRSTSTPRTYGTSAPSSCPEQQYKRHREPWVHEPPLVTDLCRRLSEKVLLAPVLYRHMQVLAWTRDFSTRECQLGRFLPSLKLLMLFVFWL